MICSSCQAENDDAAEVCFTCAKPFVYPITITKGSVIAGRYEILSPLGKGGMGMVYKAHDHILDETVALKTLRSDIAREPELARRFLSETKLARKVRHKNVCGIHEYGEDAGLRYIAMEYVDGIDLRRVLKESGAFPAREAFEVTLQIARGLQAIHQAGVIHRDLKTPNIMRDGRGHVRVMDFGIAKKSGSDTTLGGQVVGTPEYMSPEQARGHRVDFRSDIYALGIVIYEIFTGHVPFHGDTPIATILMHLHDAPPLDGTHAQIPGPLVHVLRKALSKEPAERYGSAREMVQALEAAYAECFPADGSAGVSAPESMTEALVALVDDATPTAARTPTPLPRAIGPPEPGLKEGRGSPARPLPRPGPGSRAVAPWIVAGVATLLLVGVLLRNQLGVAPPNAAPAATSATLQAPPPSVAGPGNGQAEGAISPPATAAPNAPSAPPLAARESVAPPPTVKTPAKATPVAVPATRAPPSESVPTLAPPVTTPALVESPRPTSPPMTTPPPTPVPTPASATAPPPTVPAAPAVRRGDLVEDGPGVVRPQVIELAEPTYPSLARRLKRTARVVVKVLVDENAKVVKAEVVQADKSNLGFNEAAIEAAYRNRFTAATKQGIAVKMWVEIPFGFNP